MGFRCVACDYANWIIVSLRSCVSKNVLRFICEANTERMPFYFLTAVFTRSSRGKASVKKTQSLPPVLCMDPRTLELSGVLTWLLVSPIHATCALQVREELCVTSLQIPSLTHVQFFISLEKDRYYDDVLSDPDRTLKRQFQPFPETEGVYF